MVGRTLTQHAVPTTFGLKAAQWLTGVQDAAEQVSDVLGRLPVQYGGAAGTRALLAHLAPDADPTAVVRRVRRRRSGCGPPPALAHPARDRDPDRRRARRVDRRPRRRSPPTCCCSADPRSARSARARPQVAAARRRCPTSATRCSACWSGAPPCRRRCSRRSSTSPPPPTHDERPDGAWHSEWPALTRLLELAVTAASQARRAGRRPGGRHRARWPTAPRMRPTTCWPRARPRRR